MAGSMGRRARKSGWDTNSSSNLSFVNHSGSVDNQFGVRSSEFRIYPVSPKRSRAFQFRHLRSLDFDDGKPVQSNSFGRSISDGVLQSESIRGGYWNGYVSCDPGVGQTPNYEMMMMTKLMLNVAAITWRNVVFWCCFGFNVALHD